jgi:hypothetical protein
MVEEKLVFLFAGNKLFSFAKHKFFYKSTEDAFTDLSAGL